ncbi:sodium-coupled monocarboxylate transporter 1-like isoform X2 [Harmonia axyridis]|uniref:sodium-coupled monocarboxylate transporter 1-like isoform X2 n=1 Tax=Harmonia axyridis TaxID=115357 RepID=UPI001E276C17|nr:sodium-coupled monocarboxylate transporter 1-like isoform X2 [Harmonia axyridis]
MAEIVLEGIQSSVDVGEKTVLGLGVADIGAAMQRFDWQDYGSFVVMLFLCVLVGFYFGFIKTSENAQEYLMGGRNMQIFPVAMSLLASYISGISMLGIPTEVYVYGIQYLYIIGGLFIMAFVFQYIYLPVFHNLNLTSTYEYHERRFDRKVRLFGSILFSFGMITWLPLVIYVPALAFNQVTGVNVHYTTPAVCIICIFYTSMGGLKAVVWTDVIQTIIMFGSLVLVVVKGTLDAGGFSNVWQRNWDSERIERPNFDLDPSSRHTVWSLSIGGFVYFLQNGAVTQNMVQRFLSLSTIKSATKSLWLYIFLLTITMTICCYAGMVIYAIYHKCDPLTTMLAKEKDQLLPLLVMETIGEYPGLPGIFVAGIFSAALSSLSTGLNSMAAIVLEDFVKPFVVKPLTDKQTHLLMEVTVIVVGVICVGLVVVVERLGTVLQLTMSLNAIASGPSLGIFTMGILLPWVNAKENNGVNAIAMTKIEDDGTP